MKTAFWSARRPSTGWAPTALRKWLYFGCKTLIENQRITTAEGKTTTLLSFVREDLWPVVEAQFTTPNSTKAVKNWGYTAAVNVLVTKIFPTKSLISKSLIWIGTYARQWRWRFVSMWNMSNS